MGQKILITGSRQASPAMLAKAAEVVDWARGLDHVILVGDAPGVDAAVRQACHELHVMAFVYGAYGTMRGPGYPGEQPATIEGDYLARDRVMAECCDLCVGIWNGVERSGTAATMRYVQKLGKRVIVRRFEGVEHAHHAASR